MRGAVGEILNACASGKKSKCLGQSEVLIAPFQPRQLPPLGLRLPNSRMWMLGSLGAVGAADAIGLVVADLLLSPCYRHLGFFSTAPCT